MPQRNIYVTEENDEVFERAKELAEDKSLSEMVVEALSHYIKDKESGKESKYGRFKRERMPVGKIPRERKAPDRWLEFIGRRIAHHEGEGQEPVLKSKQYMVYQGIGGGLLLVRKLLLNGPSDVRETSETDYVVGESVEELKMESDKVNWNVPISFLNEVKEELGGQIIETPLQDRRM